MEIFDARLRRNPTRQERNTLMEPLGIHAAEAADMLGVGRSGVFRLIAAKQLETIKIGGSRHISVPSIRHVAAQSAVAEAVEARTERSGESVTSEHAEEVGDVLSA
jgi:excisionase family DNA binding protein